MKDIHWQVRKKKPYLLIRIAGCICLLKIYLCIFDIYLFACLSQVISVNWYNIEHWIRELTLNDNKKLTFLEDLTSPRAELVLGVIVVVVVVLAVLVDPFVGTVAEVAEEVSSESQGIEDLEEENDEGSLEDGWAVHSDAAGEGREVEAAKSSAKIL